MDHRRHQQFKYVGVEHFRIALSGKRASCLAALEQLVSALQERDPSAVHRAGRLVFLSHDIRAGKEPTELVSFLDALLARLRNGESVAGDILCLLSWAGIELADKRSVESGQDILATSEFARYVLESVISAATVDFYAAVEGAWKEMELAARPGCCPDFARLPSFQVLASWVSRVDSAKSWHLLLRWLKHECAWIRNQTAWSLRHWWSPDLSMALCGALLMGIGDEAAYEHSFFLFWRLEQLADPTALSTLQSLIGTGFDREIPYPGGPPANRLPSNMMRKAIRACGGSIDLE